MASVLQVDSSGALHAPWCTMEEDPPCTADGVSPALGDRIMAFKDVYVPAPELVHVTFSAKKDFAGGIN